MKINSNYFFIVFALIFGIRNNAFAYSIDKNDCSIGVCNFELIKNESLDQFDGIIAALNKSTDGDETVEIKSLSTCKKISTKQFEHMIFEGNPKSAKEDMYESGTQLLSSSVLKYAIVNKDYIIREIQFNFTYPGGLFKKTTTTRNKIVTIIQDKKTCELKKFIKSAPFAINNK